jgi:hypothetical protein
VTQLRRRMAAHNVHAVEVALHIRLNAVSFRPSSGGSAGLFGQF